MKKHSNRILNEEQANRKNNIESMETKNGGYTKETLNGIGVDWPPKKGWKSDYIFNGQDRF